MRIPGPINCRKHGKDLMIVQNSHRTIITKDEFDIYTVSTLKI